MKINYDGKNICLFYNFSESPIDISSSIMLGTSGSGKGKDYCCVEQQAQMYLIKNAMDKIKKRNTKLTKIVGIKQDVKSFENEEIEIILHGTAVFKKN